MKYWKPILALVLAAALIYFAAFHTDRFLADFWPLDNSRVGPNLAAAIVQYALLLILVALLYPPFRRAVERFAQRHVADLKAHITSEHAKIHERIDHTHARLEALHARMDAAESTPARSTKKKS